MRSLVFGAFLSVLLVASLPAAANDSTAELGAGGLRLVQTDKVSLLSEDLFISRNQVRVTYHFRNTTDAPVSFVVAFPLPVIDASNPGFNVILPDSASDNFVDFKVAVDGQPVTPKVFSSALALGVDRSAELKEAGLPLNPYADGLYDRLAALPADKRAALNRLGLVVLEGNGATPAWTFQTTFYWEQTFAPGRDVVVEHTYRPVYGSGFFTQDTLDLPEYRSKYCLDRSFVSAATAKLKALKGKDIPYLGEERISYILTTANNWFGPIKSFRLVIDKSDANALVSFCGKDVRKISTTQFEMKATDFSPERDLEILIVYPLSAN